MALTDVSKSLVLYDLESSGFVLPFIYSTLFTSVWLWLYGLARLAVRVAGRANRSISFCQWMFDLDKPLRVLGFVSMIIVTLVYLAIPVVRYFA